MKALFEHRMLPRVMAGSSVGSIVAGIVATRTDDELRETFRWVNALLSGATPLSVSLLNSFKTWVVRTCAGVMLALCHQQPPRLFAFQTVGGVCALLLE